MTNLHRDWIEFLKLLNAHRVRFLVVGGHAVAAAGRPRFIADLDIWIDSNQSNAEKVARAVREFGFGDIDPDRLTKPGLVVFMGKEPFRIDLLTSIDGVTFRSAWPNRVRGKLGGVLIPFLGRRELLRNKRAAGRPKDLADIALLSELASRGRRKKSSGRQRRPN